MPFGLVLATQIASARVEFFTGNELYAGLQAFEKAEKPEDVLTSSVMFGYALGVAASQDGKLYCLPERATRGQLADVIRRWLSEKPAIRHLPASALIELALANSYPCPKK